MSAGETVFEAHDIIFRTTPEYEWTAKPTRSVGFAPEWFKNLKPRTEVPDRDPSDPDPPPMGSAVATAKLCSPFQDALQMGYMIPLPFQAFVRTADDGTTDFSWTPPPGVNWQLIGTHSREQLGWDLEAGGLFKFNTPWSIELPEGYSALYTHPLNRPDLPFFSFSGVVEHDAYRSPVNIPFMWIGAPGQQFLDAGTPVAQVIPFKREEWRGRYETDATYDELLRDSRVALMQVQGYTRRFRAGKHFR